MGRSIEEMDHDRPDGLLIWASGGKPLGVRARNSLPPTAFYEAFAHE
jgi:hypothetical protein